MARILKLDDDENGRRRFAIYWQSLLLGAHAERPRPIDVLRSEARLHKSLSAASKPIMYEDKPTRLRELDGKASLLIEQPEIAMLESYIPTVAWRPDSAADVVDALDWLVAAPVADAKQE